METLISFLTTLNSLSPLAVIALLETILFLLVKGKTAADGKVETIVTNHLHEVPSIADAVKEMAETFRRMETKMSDEYVYLRGKFRTRKQESPAIARLFAFTCVVGWVTGFEPATS